ncbi:MAG: 50S ribosomal protein L4, partial [Candidatus Nealsonbacteria bacterium CG11_big_fil_rev_8_21_14_0_20_39_9]
TPKTKSLAEIIKNWKLKIKDLKEGSILMALPKAEKNLIVAARNIPKINTVEARNLNVLDLLSFKYLIMPKETIKTIKETFLK